MLVKPHLRCCVWLLAFPFKKDSEAVERVC